MAWKMHEGSWERARARERREKDRKIAREEIEEGERRREK